VFLPALAGVRLARFLIEGGLAAYYGRGILRFMESSTFTAIVITLTTLAIVGTVISAIAMYRSIKRDKRKAATVQ
jgi:hypothetical protein